MMSNIYPHEELNREWHDLLSLVWAGEIHSPDSIAHQAASLSARPIVLFIELEDARRSWNELLEMIAPEKNADRLVTRLWTLKDLMAHVASWASEFQRQVERAVQGKSFDYAILHALSKEGPHEWNHMEVAKREGASISSLKQEFDDQTRCLQDSVLTLPEAALQTEMEFPISPSGDPSMLWAGNIGQIINMKCMHDHWHIARLTQWFHSLESYRGDRRR